MWLRVIQCETRYSNVIVGVGVVVVGGGDGRRLATVGRLSWGQMRTAWVCPVFGVPPRMS